MTCGLINYLICQGSFWNNFNIEMKKVLKYTFDKEYQEQYKKLLEDNNMDIKDIIIPKITKQFQDILINYIDNFIEEHTSKPTYLFDMPEQYKKSTKKEAINNVSSRTNKK